MDRARVVGAVVSLALIAATLEPLDRKPYDDGFPLSTYPMFATKRPTVQTYHYALGYSADGKRHTLTPSMVGSGEILQALRILEHAVSRGSAETKALCEAIAGRVAREEDFASITQIRIVRGTHDAVEYLGEHRIGTELERMRCEVRR